MYAYERLCDVGELRVRSWICRRFEYCVHYDSTAAFAQAHQAEVVVGCRLLLGAAQGHIYLQCGIMCGNRQWWAHHCQWHWAPHSPNDKVFKALSIVAPFDINTERGIVIFVYFLFITRSLCYDVLNILGRIWLWFLQWLKTLSMAQHTPKLSVFTMNKVTKSIQSLTKETRFITNLWNYWRQTVFKGKMPNKLGMQNIHIPVFCQYLCSKAYHLEHYFDWSMKFRICRL